MNSSRTARRRTPRAALQVYAGAVGLAGLVCAVALLLLAPPWQDLHHQHLQLGVLAAALLLGELVPVPVTRGDGTISPITTSTTFAVALVLLGPLSWVVLVLVAAVVLDDVRTRKSPLQVLFNSGQYVLALCAARAVLAGLSQEGFLDGYTTFSGDLLLPALAAGLVFAVVNDGLVAVVAALATGRPVLAVLTEDLRFKLETSGVLTALGPAAALSVDVSVLLVPLLALPVMAVRRTALTAALRERQSLHDPLTGLGNRTLFNQSLQRAVTAQAERSFAVLLLDLDHFKDVNDVLGHSVGDELLCVVAERIAGTSREHSDDAEVARLGGDEFAVLLRAPDALGAARALASRLLEEFSRPVDVAGTRLAVDTSVGITASSGEGPLEAHTAMQQADIALYDAKQDRGRASVYDAAVMTSAAERLELLPELRSAVDSGQLVVLYQPQVEASSGRVVGAEALVRWDHPERGRLAPDCFIALAESTGLITSLTLEVLRQSLSACAQWSQRAVGVGVSVNISARQLSDRSLPQQVAQMLSACGLPATALTIEVTESSLMADPKAAAAILASLREMGVRLAIDDFGTGYSSLTLLQQLRVDELKIDRSFVASLTRAPHDEIIVRSTIELAHNLGLVVVAEGVQEDDTSVHLRRLGCDHLQGHLYSEPLELPAFEALLRTTAASPAVEHVTTAGTTGSTSEDLWCSSSPA